MELFNRTFTSQSVGLATGLDAKSIQNWAARGLIIGQRDGEGKGHHINFSWYNLMEIAIAGELLDLGVTSVQGAFAASQRFSHSSSGGVEWTGDDGLSVSDGDPYRAPGMAWHHDHGETFLFVWKGGSHVQLVNGEISLYRITPSAKCPTAFVAVNVSAVFARICSRLELDYRVVLDEVYLQEAKG